MAQPTWTTLAGSIGTFSEEIAVNYTFLATPSVGSNTLQYTLLNGVFPLPFTDVTQFNLSSSGILTGTPAQVSTDTAYSFTIRVIEYNGATYVSFSDRTFSLTITGTTAPSFVTPGTESVPVQLYTGPTYLPDSTWDPVQIAVDNPDPVSVAVVRLVNGSLPEGLEINESGLIQGYATPPLDSIGAPTTATHTFTLEVSSGSGSGLGYFSITVVNQETLFGFAGRAPAILNTRPPTFYIPITDPNSAYYLNSLGNIGTYTQNNYFLFKILGNSFDAGPLTYNITGTLPPGLTSNEEYTQDNTSITITSSGLNYAPGDQLRIVGASIGGVTSDNDLTFTVDTVGGSGELTGISLATITGINTDGNSNFSLINVQTDTGIGSGAIVTVDKMSAGWITGDISTSALLVEPYTFTAQAVNSLTTLVSDTINFTMTVVNQTDNVPLDISVTWQTASNLGTLDNGNISTFSVSATTPSDLPLTYSLESGTLPPNLQLMSNGEIVGALAFESQATLIPQGTTTDYQITIKAENATYPEISSTKEFTISTYQKFVTPYENLYIQALPSIADRSKLNSLLQNIDIIPDESVYRITDPYFGRASSVVYQHMFGIPSSSVQDYIDASLINHYWRNITLGPLKTAIARDSANNIIYEVVYSEIVDDLINPSGVSISKEIFWPRTITTSEGSYGTLYPNSLPNMRTQISGSIPGQVTDASILPLWMTSQQPNGGNLGFLPAWVICYTNPGQSEVIKSNIETMWEYKLNEINFQLDRFEVNKSLTFDYNTGVWGTLPSDGVSDNSHDQYIYFPQRTILN